MLRYGALARSYGGNCGGRAYRAQDRSYVGLG